MTAYTPIYNLPYVEASDLVANYPTVSEELAENVETAISSSGKIKQIVRATDVTQRTTSSTSYVDVTGVSVTITPTSASSVIYVMVTVLGQTAYNSSLVGANPMFFQITDSANTALSGAQEAQMGAQNYSYSGDSYVNIPLMLWGRAAPATTSAVTYKLRFRVNHASVVGYARNNTSTAQIYAIEVDES